MEDISKRSLRITRKFNAPIDLLWKVLTTPEYIKDWWGPEGFTNTIRTMEVVKGGRWEFTMHGPDGANYENEYLYSEIIPFKKIVLDHLKEPKFSIIINLFDEGEQTSIEWQNIFEKIPDLEQAITSFKVDEGLKQNIERLSQYLKLKIMNQTKFSTNQNKLTVIRAFDAHVELVWRAWTEAELLDKWWAPKPWRSETKKMEFKEGGSRLYAMVSPGGEEHWGITDFKTIIKHQNFSGEDAFCDNHGNINTSLPVAKFINSFENDSEQTIVTVETEYASEEHLKQVIDMGMKEGLRMAFENLDEVLNNIVVKK